MEVIPPFPGRVLVAERDEDGLGYHRSVSCVYFSARVRVPSELRRSTPGRENFKVFAALMLCLPSCLWKQLIPLQYPFNRCETRQEEPETFFSWKEPPWWPSRVEPFQSFGFACGANMLITVPFWGVCVCHKAKKHNDTGSITHGI